MRECEVEKTLSLEVKKRGGIALKFISPGMSGVPDRLIMMKGERLAFVEIKAPGKKMRPLQVKRKRQFEALGFLVYCIDDKAQIGVVLDEICAT